MEADGSGATFDQTFHLASVTCGYSAEPRQQSIGELDGMCSGNSHDVPKSVKTTSSCAQ